MCGLVVLILVLPVIGGVVGYGIGGAVGAIVGGLCGLAAALAITVLPFAALVSSERRKAQARPQRRPSVPWSDR